MSERATRLMSEAEFLAWQRGQPSRYELVDGVPQAMTGARIRHDIARGNAEAHLRAALRHAKNGCLPLGADIAIRVFPGQLRRPDVSVICPPIDMEDLVSSSPRLVFAVLSAGTKRVDEYIKLDEYRAMDELENIILVSPTELDVVAWSRDAARIWQRQRYRTLESAIPLPTLGVTLPLAVIYDGIALER